MMDDAIEVGTVEGASVAEKPARKRARRGAGEGSIYRRVSDGKWCGAVAIGRTADGRPRRRLVYGDSQREVVDKLAQLKADAREGRLVEPSRLTLDAFLTSWIDRLVQKGRIRGRTADEYRRLAGLITRHVGGDLLTTLTPARVEQLYAEWAREGVGQRSAQAAARVLHGALKDAVRQRLLAVNPCAAVDTPRVPPRPHRGTLSDDQVAALLAAAERDETVAGPLATLLLTTGVRISEALGLTWGHIDLARRTVRIERTLAETTSGQLSFEATKTAKSKRTIELPAFAVAVLVSWWERSGRPEGDALVFCGPRGAPLRRSNLARRQWADLFEAAGVEPFGFHECRHYHASQMIRHGVPVLVAAARLGHSRASITTDVYGHLAPTDGGLAARLVEELHGGGRRPAIPAEGGAEALPAEATTIQ
jgi:integrase